MIFSDQSLDKKDTKSLRLTSKELNPAATREFAKRYLTEPFFTLSRYSLQSLVDMCRHPIFSTHIQSIGFLATTLPTRGLAIRARNADVGRLDDLVANLEEISDYTRICKDQIQLKNSGDTKKLLVVALEALDHPISITVTNGPEPTGPHGVIGLPSTIYRYDESLGRCVAKLTEIDSKMRTFFSLVEETVASLKTRGRIQLAGMKVNISRRSTDATSFFSADCIETGQLDGVYSDLTKLHLDFNLEAFRCPVILKSLEHLFKAAPKLQELTIISSCMGSRVVGKSTLDRLSKIFDIETAFELKVLVLERVPCTSETLLQLMKRYKQTLVDIKLSRVTLLGCWKPCLSWMRKGLDLKNLHISHPHTVHRHQLVSRGPFRPTELFWQVLQTMPLQGKENVRAGLDSIT
jgi:hypothetical protein